MEGVLHIYQYPWSLNKEGVDLISNLITSLENKNREGIAELVRTFLKKMKNTDLDNLDQFYKSSQLKRLSDGIREMRIPPDHVHGGVVRIYYFTHPEISNAILIVHAEFKKPKDTKGFEIAKQIKREAIHEYRKRRNR